MTLMLPMVNRQRDYPRCNAKRRQQPEGVTEPLRCLQPAGWGTDHAGVPGTRCKLHGGATRDQRTYAHHLTIERDATRALQQLREGPIVHPSRVSPAQALLGVVTEQSILVAWLRRRIEQELGDRWVGDKMAATARGDLYEVSEEERALVRMYREALGDLSRMAKAAHEAGVMEAELRLSAATGTKVGEIVRDVLRKSDLEPEQQKAISAALSQRMAVMSGPA